MPRFRSRFAALAGIGATFFLTITGVAAAAPAALPASVLESCPASSVCFYEHQDFGGTVLVIPAGAAYPDLRAFPCAGCRSSKHNNNNGTWSDQLSSWVNNTGQVYCWYWHENYAGRNDTVMNAGTALSYVGKTPNDQASSIGPC
ncbi:peptidase inhibitor family I36 protein [Amycolatopsis sp. A133]|uniref:peptidase inhibitor family I36 protein n=1 Tax=Amycolatopsis sp. A133 TaxID=3064472 RepID=UPI0027FB554B|nr:peptidase inhibitor family I36 protein [Amycolatopsis sp. A133]MDQ7808662.1 peptidase inhibitor family I36 protein [Amycolatopsis sp. A133]